MHGDLLHGNMLVSSDAETVDAVFVVEVLGAWRFSVRRCVVHFLAPWCEGIAGTDPLSGLIAAPAVRSKLRSLIDAADRHHCCELHIGLTHLGWNIWTENRAELELTILQLSEVVERGPLPLFVDSDTHYD